jgi:hypothetical protein
MEALELCVQELEGRRTRMDTNKCNACEILKKCSYLISADLCCELYRLW